ncbi:glycosyltransferase [Streptomyces sp. NPDC004542]|uniref:glycosyltransferase n=1 Tax=Streptomyces sp. NPDC004542 TaxID=3154281 RepID=UPI0033ACE4AF
MSRALREAGHEVRIATGADFGAQIEEAGFPAVSVGPTRAFAKAERLRRHPESTGVAPQDQQRFHVTKVWAGIYAPYMLPDLLRAAEDWRPDLIVYDIASFGGPLVCALTGIPGVSHSFGPAFSCELLKAAGEAVVPLWAEHGLTAPESGGMLDAPHVDIWPGSLQLPDSTAFPVLLPMRAPRPAPRNAAPPPFPDSGRPRVHVTLGTIFNQNPELFRIVIEGLRDLDVTVVLTSGPDQDPSVLGPLPPWVHALRFVPHERLLPHCDLVISHSGAGTTLAALEHGVPSLLLPQAADGFRVAEACVAAGAGSSLDPSGTTPETVRRECAVLLGDPAYAEGALRLRREIAAMPAPEDVVLELMPPP